MKMINLIVDDKTITVPEGTNIFQASLDNGIYIPGLCYHPKLSQFGGCRLCMVEVTERRTAHRFACAHPVSEGMIVKVNTPKVVRYRRSVMEYLLAHHELSCPTCDKAGECSLQDITHELTLSPSRFNAVRMNAPVVRDNPILELNRNRCVLCGRCVSACKEIEGVGAIDFQKRGIKTYIGTAFDKPLDCSFCGGCLAVCPTGSWQDRTLEFRGRPWEFKKTQTICPYCAVGCTVVLNTKSGSVRRVTSDDHIGINEGNLCIKGRFGHEFIHSAERLKTPLIKKDGAFHPSSWDDALEYISKRFQQIINEHGGNAIGGIGSEKCTNEDNYLFQKFCRSVLRTNTIDNLSNLKSPSLNSLMYESVIRGIASTSLKEIEHANTLFFFGTDMTEAHPVAGTMARKAMRMNNANLIIANIRNISFSGTAKNDIRLTYSFGSQILFIHALIKIIFDEKLIDLKKAESSISNFHELHLAFDTFSVKEASQVTAISEEMMRTTARLLTKSGNCCIVCGRDVEEDSLNRDIIKALMNLCVLMNASSPDTDHSKASLLFSRSHNNSQGVNDMGVVPEFFPGYSTTSDVSNRENIEKLWGVKFSDDIFMRESKNIFELARNGALKGLYIMGENPLVSYPNGKEVLEAFQKTGFTVVQDVFLTETAQLADVVLPTVTFAEKEGTFTNMGMTVQRLNKVIQPSGVDAKPDWQIICELAKKMGYSYSYVSPKDILSEIESVVPIYSGINYDRLKRKEFYWASSVSGSRNKLVKYLLDIVQPESLEIKQNKDFPFVLLTGVSLNHQGTFSRYSNALVSVSPECFAEINRKDAQKMNIHNGDAVVIESSQNKITLKAKVAGKSPEGIVFVSEDYEWMPINLVRTGVYTSVKIYKETGQI
ncbi:MAG: molybdopterin-dependent oxidoreductase [Candidatus Jettenia sp. CY-1]|nr:molybdopterin-dependent oxidoreductase [Candidatus Jettenia sp.]WKZ20028.1 MAG: molybdopterin-dependent oxidoreductase [Candidatus Jettenia sp. CY-1]